MIFDSLGSPLSVAMRAKLIVYHGGLKIGKLAVHDEQASWNDLYVAYLHDKIIKLSLKKQSPLLLIKFKICSDVTLI